MRLYFWVFSILIGLGFSAGCGDSTLPERRDETASPISDAGDRDAEEPEEDRDGVANEDGHGDEDGEGEGGEVEDDEDGHGDLCAETESLCGEECVETQSNSAHCGSCDAACVTPVNATATCVEGGCAYQCEAGFIDHDGDLGSPDGTGCEIECVPSNDGVEICDGVDNDCNGEVDEDTAEDAALWYEDADGDGYGDDASTLRQCAQPTGYVDQAGDCDDSNAAVYPGADEICDGVDNSCDGHIDVDAVDSPTWFADADSDGYGDDASTLKQCAQPTGYIDQAGDCDDTKAAINPSADEVCDGVDNNCDTRVDEDEAIDAQVWFADTDADTYGDDASTVTQCNQPSGYVIRGGDCDDSKAAVNPGTDERCDGLDTNCNGQVDEDSAVDVETWYEDADGDGYGDSSSTRTQCYLPAGYVDNDDDCRDTDDTVYPGAPGLCDGKDNDCNGQVDEIRPISESPPSVSLTGRITNTNPPKIMAVPTDTDDSFCVAHLTSNNIVFSLVNAAGTRQGAVRSLVGLSAILDIDWTTPSGTSDGKCAALISRRAYQSGSYVNKLVLAQWSLEDSTIVFYNVSDNYEPAAPSVGDFSAALYHLLAPSDCGGLECLASYWYVAFVEKKTSSTYRLVTTRQIMFASDDADFGQRVVVDDSLSTPTDVALGATPKWGDDMMIVWYSTTQNRWNIGGFEGLRDNWNTTPTVYNSISDSPKRFKNPTIHRVQGFSGTDTSPVAETKNYITLANSSNDYIKMYFVKGGGPVFNSYHLEEQTNIPLSGSSGYVGRQLMAPNISARRFDINRRPLGWYIQPYDDALYRMNWLTSTGTCAVGYCYLRAWEFSNPNFNSGNEYLSVRRTDSYLQTLRLIKTNPVTVVIDELTCH